LRRVLFKAFGKCSSACSISRVFTASRLLKKSFASTGKDGVVAVVEGQLNLDRAVVLEFG
jgi:hypothetical protein